MYYSIQTISPIAAQSHKEGKRIVLATGFFDLLHVEHINFLKNAKKSGDILIVAVESDVRARALKGPDRPFQPQKERCEQVAVFADYVIALSDDFDHQEAYESLMSAVRPDVYAVSSHTQYLENKRALTEKYGGVLRVVHEHNPATSTTQIIKSRRPDPAGQHNPTSQIISLQEKPL
jgi:cytidyltransferase-like protein